jgi:hypothetical protein
MCWDGSASRFVAELANESGKVSVVTRHAATLITMATVVLCAGCGDGSNKKGASRVTQVGPYPIVAKEREFQTVIPRGYANRPSVAQYWAVRPVEDGISTNVLVVRFAASKELGLSTFAHRVLGALRRNGRSVAPLQPLSVDGEPALALDYLVTSTGTVRGKVTHVRQVLVKHGPWVFSIRDLAVPAQYPGSVEALEEVLRNWRWR